VADLTILAETPWEGWAVHVDNDLAVAVREVITAEDVAIKATYLFVALGKSFLLATLDTAGITRAAKLFNRFSDQTGDTKPPSRFPHYWLPLEM